MNTEKRALRAPTASTMALMAGFAMCATAMQVLVSQIIDEFQLVSAQQGLTNSVISLGNLLAVMSVPFLQGRVRKTLLLGVSGVIQTLMLVFTGASSSFYILLAACLFLGVGGGWIDNYANAVIVDIHRQNSAKYVGMLHGFYAVGAIFTPLVVQGVLLRASWRVAYFAIAIVAAVLAVQFIGVMRASKKLLGQTTDAEQKLTAAQLGALLKDRYNLLVVLCACFYGASQNGLLTWLVRYMKLQFNAEALGSLTVSIFWVCATLSRFVAPRLRAAPMKIVAFGLAVAAATHTAGVLSGSPAVMLVMTAINGLASGQCLPMLIHVSLSRYPQNTSTPTALIVLINRVGLMVMPTVIGAAAALSMTFGMLLTSAASLLALGLAVAALVYGRRAAKGG